MKIEGFDEGNNEFNINGLKSTYGFNVIPSSLVPGCIYAPTVLINNGLSYCSDQSENITCLYSNSVSVGNMIFSLNIFYLFLQIWLFFL